MKITKVLLLILGLSFGEIASRTHKSQKAHKSHYSRTHHHHKGNNGDKIKCHDFCLKNYNDFYAIYFKETKKACENYSAVKDEENKLESCFCESPFEVQYNHSEFQYSVTDEAGVLMCTKIPKVEKEEKPVTTNKTVESKGKEIEEIVVNPKPTTPVTKANTEAAKTITQKATTASDTKQTVGKKNIRKLRKYRKRL
jgi:hypothetical protein